MSLYTRPPSFSEAVVSAMQALFPEELADRAWDNTGLLIDQAQSPSISREPEGRVLLTNDLTPAVVNEALQHKVNIIVSYHPVIFRPLKSLTNHEPMQASLLKLIAAGISVYCPHTAVDAAPGGLNDWLCDIMLKNRSQSTRTAIESISSRLSPALQQTYQNRPVGYGRLVELESQESLVAILKDLSAGLGDHRYMSIASPPTLSLSRVMVSKIAVCVGSGASVFKDLEGVDLLVTGEMSHHDALRQVGLGRVVVTMFHSNSERAFLAQRLKSLLEQRLKDNSQPGEVLVSRADADPFRVIDVEKLS